MNCKHIYFIVALLFCTTGLFAQLGIKMGLNIANEIRSFNRADVTAGFKSDNLTGYQIGLVYQAMPKKSGLGFEIAALISQKGSTFSDSTDVIGIIKQGYKEMNYVEVPLNLRYRLSLGVVGVYAFGGVYGGYSYSGKVVDEKANTSQIETFSTTADRIDYGYNFGGGLEIFRKIQLGATWSRGLKDTSNTNVGLPVSTKATNKVMSFNLVYLF